MNDIVSVVGARPQFIKAAMVSRALLEAGISERMVHTGQHYDPDMSAVFFDELRLSPPEANLNVGSGSHAEQTGQMMVGLEEYLATGPAPECVLVYGDTNSTVAAAVTARKMLIPLAHVEAGLRSFNRRMPEEINRVITDRLSDFLFCPTESAVKNLAVEGLQENATLTGDVMYDAIQFVSSFTERAEAALPDRPYLLATVHRAENVDDPARLAEIIRGLGLLARPVFFPVHPRTRSRLQGIALPDNIILSEPLSYVRMIAAIKSADRVITDSGGLQKESLWLDTPCITLRDETEWIESLERSWNVLVGASPAQLLMAVELEPTGPSPPVGRIQGQSASNTIASILAGA